MMTNSGAAGVSTTLSAAVFDIVVKGRLPAGDSTENVTHFIIDTASKTVVGQINLPNATKRETAVSIAVKVPSAGGPYSIGTFAAEGFRPTSFLEISGPIERMPRADPAVAR